MLHEHINKMLGQMGKDKYENKIKPVITISISQEDKEKQEKERLERERAINPLGI